MSHIILFLLLSTLILVFPQQGGSVSDNNPYGITIHKFKNWLFNNSDPQTGLPFSHVGDERFQHWTITYDSALTSLAYLAAGEVAAAKRIIDFYISTPQSWRLGGVIEAVNVRNPVLGEDWSVRTGSNVWLGLASVHLYKKTREHKYLTLAQKLAELALRLQNTLPGDPNLGAVRLGPRGEGKVAGDQHLAYDAAQAAFYDIYSTEHNIDAYALFNLLLAETKEERYQEAAGKILSWLKRIAYNADEHRFNRGFYLKVDPAVATDIQSWGLSALGREALEQLEPDAGDKILQFVEKNCVTTSAFVKPDGQKVIVRGVDFVDVQTATKLGREPLVSPEWTFQLINAYQQMAVEAGKRGDIKRVTQYSQKRQELVQSILELAVTKGDQLTYPYATAAEAVIGHEYRTPRANNYSSVGVAYAIMGLLNFDPLVSDRADK